MKTPKEVLREVCRYKDADDMEDSDDVTISEAKQAMEAYHAQLVPKSREEAIKIITGLL